MVNAVGEQTCRRLEVSPCRDASTARVVQSFERHHGDPERCARMLQLLGNDRPVLLMDSQAKHVTVAAGVSDLLMRFPPDASFHDSVWDQAAGSLLIEASGGRVTDLGGGPLDFATGRRLLRNQGMLHQMVYSMLPHSMQFTARLDGLPHVSLLKSYGNQLGRIEDPSG